MSIRPTTTSPVSSNYLRVSFSSYSPPTPDMSVSTTSEPPFCCALFLRRSQRLHTSSMSQENGKSQNNYEYCENLAGRAPDLERKAGLGGTEGPVDGQCQGPNALRVHVDVYVVQVGVYGGPVDAEGVWL